MRAFLLAALLASCFQTRNNLTVAVLGGNGPIKGAWVDANSQKHRTNKKGVTHFILNDAQVWLVVWADGYSPETIRQSLEHDTALVVRLVPLSQK